MEILLVLVVVAVAVLAIKSMAESAERIINPPPPPPFGTQRGCFGCFCLPAAVAALTLIAIALAALL